MRIMTSKILSVLKRYLETKLYFGEKFYHNTNKHENEWTTVIV